jgi:cytochrome c-type biogenesis protein CcmH
MPKVLLALLALCLAAAVHAADAPLTAAEPELEAKMLRISAELRCLVCQNQTIADSNAELAVDLRNEIREKIQAGMSDAEIKDFMVARYGDFVLYRPPVKNTTLVLWVGPFLLLAVGGGILVFNLRRRRQQAAEPELSRDEQSMAESLLHTDPTKETT